MKTKALLALLAGVAGCTVEAPRPPAPKKAPAATAVAKKDPAPAPKKAPAAAAEKKNAAPTGHAAPKGGNDIKWAGPVRWRTWEDGLAEAARTGRPICLVVYADWCPRCRELAPVFADPEIAALAERLVMIRQDADERPAWLSARFDRFGTYVPRVFFLDSKGAVLEDITSGNARYPYFYTPHGVERLKAAMRRATTG